MSAKSYRLDFEGYWREPNIGGLPAASGIYGVYAGSFNSIANTVSLRKLIYIGEAEDVRGRVAKHERWSDWRRQLGLGEQICFNAALIAPKSDRERAEAAMINRHKPVCNVEFVNNFPYDTTTISTSGRIALMDSNFTVYRNAGSGLLTGLYGLSR